MAEPRWASIRQQPHHKCCKLKTFPHSEHNNWFWDCSLKGRLAIHRYDQSNTMIDHSSIITLNYLWLQIIFQQMCRWIVFKKCRWVVFNCVDELSPKTVSMSCLDSKTVHKQYKVQSSAASKYNQVLSELWCKPVFRLSCRRFYQLFFTTVVNDCVYSNGKFYVLRLV